VTDHEQIPLLRFRRHCIVEATPSLLLLFPLILLPRFHLTQYLLQRRRQGLDRVGLKPPDPRRQLHQELRLVGVVRERRAEVGQGGGGGGLWIIGSRSTGGGVAVISTGQRALWLVLHRGEAGNLRRGGFELLHQMEGGVGRPLQRGDVIQLVCSKYISEEEVSK